MTGPAQLGLLLVAALLLTALVVCDWEWRARKRLDRDRRRAEQQDARDAATAHARRLRADAKARWAASVSYPQLDATPLPARSALRETTPW